MFGVRNLWLLFSDALAVPTIYHTKMTISQMLREAIQASQQCIVPERHTIKNFSLDIPHLRMLIWCIFFYCKRFRTSSMQFSESILLHYYTRLCYISVCHCHCRVVSPLSRRNTEIYLHILDFNLYTCVLRTTKK